VRGKKLLHHGDRESRTRPDFFFTDSRRFTRIFLRDYLADMNSRILEPPSQFPAPERTFTVNPRSSAYIGGKEVVFSVVPCLRGESVRFPPPSGDAERGVVKLGIWRGFPQLTFGKRES